MSCSEDKTLLGECGEKIGGNEQRKFVPLLSVTLRDDAHLCARACQSAGELGIRTRATVSSCGQKLS